MMKIKRLMAFVLALILTMSVFTVFASAESVGLGDLDGNGAVDSSDYIEIKEKFLSGALFSADETKLADVNGDGIVSSADVVSVVATVRGELKLPVHAYDNACDTECNVCKTTRQVPDHVYGGDCDSDCNECGAIRRMLIASITTAKSNSC